MMRRLFLLTICIALVSIFVGSIYAVDMESFFKTIFEPTRNDYSGVTGIEFTANEDINVLALGRPITTTFTQEHTITLWSVSDQGIIAEVVVSPNSAYKYEVENGAYTYTMLDSPIGLAEGESYRLMCEEFAGGDNWATCFIVTPGEDTTNVATINGIPWGPTGVYPANFDPTPNKVDIGCTFFYGAGIETAVNSAGKLCSTWANLKIK